MLPASPLVELRDPNIPVARLRQLALDACELTRRWVARHPNTPADVLLAMLDDQDCWVPWNLAQNPAAAPELIDQLVARRSHLDMVAANRNAPGRVLTQLAGEPEMQVRAAAALNPSTPAATLAILAGDASVKVRWSLARNTSAPPEVLQGLASDKEEQVRRAVARNRNTPKPLKLALKQALGMS
jgi:hypothetical protein